MPDPAERLATTSKVVVATTVALSFISFWRGAAIVLSDLASTMYYVGGITESAIGKSAPWFVLAVMFFSFAVRSIYMESCGMFVRGGVYIVVRDSIGPTMAKLSVSSLVVDYILTGPISAVAAGQYLGRLLNEIGEYLGQGWHTDPNTFAVFFSIAVTCYFWWSNIKGVPESSHKALRIMQVTTVMVVALLIWCVLTLISRGGAPLPPLPIPSNLHMTKESLGWLDGTFWAQMSYVILIVALGHSLLAIRLISRIRVSIAGRHDHGGHVARSNAIAVCIAGDIGGGDGRRAVTGLVVQFHGRTTACQSQSRGTDGRQNQGASRNSHCVLQSKVPRLVRDLSNISDDPKSP